MNRSDHSPYRSLPTPGSVRFATVFKASGLFLLLSLLFVASCSRSALSSHTRIPAPEMTFELASMVYWTNLYSGPKSPRLNLAELPEIREQDTIVALDVLWSELIGPMYEVVVTGTGCVYFNGIANVARNGRSELSIMREQLDAIVESIEKSRFMEMAEGIESNAYYCHGAVILITVRLGTRERTYEFDTRKWTSNTSSLFRLTRSIDSISGATALIGPPNLPPDPEDFPD